MSISRSHPVMRRPHCLLLLRRAVLLRCAWCGDHAGFRRGWFKNHDSCQHCGMSVQRGQEGFELGAAAINAMLCLGALVAAGGASIAMTYPEVAARPLLIVLGAAAVLLPIVLYPFTYTIWFAIELVMEPPSSADLAAAARRVQVRELEALWAVSAS